jgi:plastocyanin
LVSVIVHVVKNACRARVRLGGLSKSLGVTGAVGALVLLSSCAGEKPTATGPTEPATSSPSATTSEAAEPECADLTGSPVARIVMDDFVFDPRCAIVTGDQKLEFVNEGKNRHSFTVPNIDFDVLAGESKTSKPIGQVLKPGETHIYECKYHRGMNADLQVE